MIIGGLQKFSLLDYPGEVSAIIFTQGCNFRCCFCYNSMLVWPACNVVPSTSDRPERVGNFRNKKGHAPNSLGKSKHYPNKLKERDLFIFLKNRINKLKAVVITGGEPTMHADLPDFIKKIKKLGFLIKLDTNGTNPEMLKKLIKEKLLDYIAMDIKAPEEKYHELVGVKVDFKKIQKSVKIIMKSDLAYEFRTTLVPRLLKKEDILKIGKIIKGAKLWYLQKFKPDFDLIDEKLKNIKPYTDKEMKDFCRIGKEYVDECYYR